MSNENRRPVEDRARREFLSKVGKTAVTAPAIALLIAASTSPAVAQYGGGEIGGHGGEGNGRGGSGGRGRGRGRGGADSGRLIGYDQS
jgi:hypothetical protein